MEIVLCVIYVRFLDWENSCEPYKLPDFYALLEDSS